MIKRTPAEKRARKEKRIAKGIALGLRNRRGITPAKQLKRLKKETQDVWSKVVRQRDGNKCVLCGSKAGLSAHHWIVHARGSLATRFIVENGVSLCYACHIFKVHQRGDADTMDGIKAYMTKFLDQETYENIKRLGKGTVDMDADNIQEIKFDLEGQLSDMVRQANSVALWT